MPVRGETILLFSSVAPAGLSILFVCPDPRAYCVALGYPVTARVRKRLSQG
jgi:hypothetical protein